MTKKQFDLVPDSNQEWLMQSILYLPLRDNNTNKKITLKQCYDLLNAFAYKSDELLERNQDLIKSRRELVIANNQYREELYKLKEENKCLQNLKEGLNELKEIGDYQAMRIKELEKENRELETKVDFYKYFQKDVRGLDKENEELKQVLGSILFEVKQDITNTSCTGEVKAFINPNSFNLISEVLRKYSGLRRWYNE